MRRLVNKGHTAENVHKVIQALTPRLQVAGLSADALGRVCIEVLLEAVGLEGTPACELGGDIVEGNVFAVEIFVHVFADLDGLWGFGGVVVEVGNVGEAQVGQDHGVVVLALLVGAEAVFPFSVHVFVGATGEGSNETVLAELAPALENPFEIVGVVVDIVIGEKDGLGLVFDVGDQLLIETVVAGHSVADLDSVLGDVVGGRGLVEIVPDNDYFIEGRDILGCQSIEVILELLWSVVGLHSNPENGCQSKKK